MGSELEYHQEFGILYGTYRYELDRLLDGFEEGAIDIGEFIAGLETRVLPHLEADKNL